MIEAERKYKVRKKDVASIIAVMFKWLWPAVPLRQTDRYLTCHKGKRTNRIRRQESAKGTARLHTKKDKCKRGPNTNRETEDSIRRRQYRRLKKKRQAYEFDLPLIVHKNRTEFRGVYKGWEVAVCIDKAEGPDGIWLGRFVELEIMVKKPRQIEAAHRILRKLARDILPGKLKREKRGYRTILLDKIAERRKRAKKKEKRRRKK